MAFGELISKYGSVRAIFTADQDGSKFLSKIRRACANKVEAYRIEKEQKREGT